MSAAEEAQQTCSRCGCAGPLHREDEVVRGCQLARLRTRVAELEDTIRLSVADEAVGRSYGRNALAVAVSAEIHGRRGQEWNGAEVTGLDGI
jgi:hypothetical protein